MVGCCAPARMGESYYTPPAGKDGSRYASLRALRMAIAQRLSPLAFPSVWFPSGSKNSPPHSGDARGAAPARRRRKKQRPPTAQ
nr:hypothetical protein RVX_1822 [Nitratidesulfovibrio sp. HK-II]